MKRKILCVSLLCSLAASLVVIDAGWLGSPAFAKKKKGQNTEVPSENNFTKGVAQFKSHDWDGAIDSFLQAIYFARNGYNPEAYFWLGKSYMAHHEDAKAIEALNKHIEQNMGGSPDGHYYLGEIYLRNDRLKEAELEASKSQTEFFGKGEKAHNLHGKILAAKGDYGSAQWEFQRALGDQPWKYTDAWQNYAETYMKQKNWAQAFKQYSAIIAAANRLEDVDLQKCYLNVGLCELAKGNHQGAIDNYHQVLEINSNNADAHLNLGMVFDSESHFSSAVKEYSEFVRCSTDEKKVQKAKERITMLEQKIRPPDDPVVKPSLYMRMHPDAPGAGGAGGQQPPQKPKPPADSGF